MRRFQFSRAAIIGFPVGVKLEVNFGAPFASNHRSMCFMNAAQPSAVNWALGFVKACTSPSWKLSACIVICCAIATIADSSTISGVLCCANVALQQRTLREA